MEENNDLITFSSRYCTTGKTMHRSSLAAQNEMQQMLEDPHVDGKEFIGIYLCEVCSTYHIGRHEQNK